MLIKYKPSSFIIYGVFIYVVLYILSPFSYKIYSIDALFYLILCFFLLWGGARLVEGGKKIYNTKWVISINKGKERILIFIMLLSLVMALLYLLYVTSLSTSYIFATEDLRSALSENRPTYTKVAEILAIAGIPCFLILSFIDSLNYKITRILSYISFFLPSIMILSVGARGTAIVSILILLFHLRILKNKKWRRTKASLTKKQRIILIFSITIVFVFIVQLFTYRKSVESFNSRSFYSLNDVEYKYDYLKLNEKLDNRLDPIYGILDYYNHSVPTFTYFYAVTKNDEHFKIYPFAYQFYYFWTIFHAINLIDFDIVDVYDSNPTKGRYSTFVLGYITDYGYFFALLMIFLTGLLLGLMWKNSQKGGICFFIDTIILTMVFLAPIYYIWSVGSISAILFFYFMIILFIRKGISINKVN